MSENDLKTPIQNPHWDTTRVLKVLGMLIQCDFLFQSFPPLRIGVCFAPSDHFLHIGHYLEIRIF